MRLRPTLVDQVAEVLAIERSPQVAPWVDVWPTDRHIEAIEDPSQRHLIWETMHHDLLGYAILSGFENRHGNIELIRVALATPGLGQGMKIMAAVISFVFEESPQTHRIWLDVLVENRRALSVYESIGFQREGVAREALLTESGRRNLLVMSLLRPEWAARNKPILR